jgi:2-polyprenyl-3-methyl-5-hydroxy-6-metoxy-1,4-benzoquinol methylase
LSVINNPFERSGLAALSDLQTPAWREVFSTLEGEQKDFLSKQHLFRSPDYKWPLDALHNWSRVWEYPYVYQHLKRYRQEHSGNLLPTVADIGSGVTFFPFSVARLGFDVVCADLDPVCRADFDRAETIVKQDPGKVGFRLIETSSLPFGDSECDIVYCISVLEHIEDFENTIHEISRILKNDGLLYLTIDLDLQGNSQIGVVRYRSLVACLHESFDLLFPDVTVHPADILDSLHGPCPMHTIDQRAEAWHWVKQDIIKPLLGRLSRPFLDLHLAVQGFALQKCRHPRG